MRNLLVKCLNKSPIKTRAALFFAFVSLLFVGINSGSNLVKIPCWLLSVAVGTLAQMDVELIQSFLRVKK
jgi:hypothetical protein